jgi:hypothetical protein
MIDFLNSGLFFHLDPTLSNALASGRFGRLPYLTRGVLSCWNKILLFGTLPKICFAEA